MQDRYSIARETYRTFLTQIHQLGKLIAHEHHSRNQHPYQMPTSAIEQAVKYVDRLSSEFAGKDIASMQPWQQVHLLATVERINQLMLPFTSENEQNMNRAYPPNSAPIDLDKIEADTDRWHAQHSIGSSSSMVMEPSERHALDVRQAVAQEQLKQLWYQLPMQLRMYTGSQAWEWWHHIQYIERREKQGHTLTYRQLMDRVELMEKIIAQLEREQQWPHEQ